MKKMMHIVATPRGSESRTLQISRAFIEAVERKVDLQVDELDLFAETLPSLTVAQAGVGQVPRESVAISGSERRRTTPNVARLSCRPTRRCQRRRKWEDCLSWAYPRISQANSPL